VDVCCQEGGGTVRLLQTPLLDSWCQEKSHVGMPRRLPPLNALRAFEAAGRHASFTGAAAELNVSHAAISRHVRGLEERLGVRLFRVVSRGVELTAPGHTYLAAVTPALDAIALATEALAPDPDGTVSVSCEPTFAVKWLMPRLGSFQALYPGIEIKIDASSALADLEHHESDVAIRYGSGTWPDLAMDLISESPSYPVGAPGLGQPCPGAPGACLLEPEQILEHKLLHEDNGALWKRWFAEAGLRSIVLPPVSGLSTMLVIEAALAGQGLALISDDLATADLASGRLVRYSDVALDYGGYFLVYLDKTMRRRAPEAFRDWILSESRDLRSS